LPGNITSKKKEGFKTRAGRAKKRKITINFWNKILVKNEPTENITQLWSRGRHSLRGGKE